LDNKRNKDVFPFSLSLFEECLYLSACLLTWFSLALPPSSHDCTAQPSNSITDQQQQQNGKATIYRLSGSLSSKSSQQQQQQYQKEAMRKTLIN
jgi:hypothetical protein